MELSLSSTGGGAVDGYAVVGLTLTVIAKNGDLILWELLLLDGMPRLCSERNLKKR